VLGLSWKSAAGRGSLALASLSAAALLGCATHPPVVVRDPVGPRVALVDPAATPGELKVYSAARVTFNSQSEYPVHTPYTILTLHGKLVRHVQNVAGLFGQDPERVSLPQGSYRIRALSAESGDVLITVVIVPGKTTVVDLDGTALPQDKEAQGQWVRLPDGHVVGWQADCTMSRCR
jgi:hypothetical protein